MRSRPTIWILLCLLLVAGAWLFWPHAGNLAVENNSPAQKTNVAAPGATAATSAASAPKISTTASLAKQTNEFAYRLSNTARSVGELKDDRRAILLENALIDTRLPLDFSIPKNLQSSGDPGAYIVQANGTIDAAFRAMLAAADAQIISYIPNNAYLVRVSAGGAGLLSASGLTASVIPYEPYYKIINSSLLGAAVRQKNLPDGAALTLGLFPDDAAQTVAQIEKMGGTILATDRSPFGPMVRVLPPQDWTALAVLPGVQIVEPYHARVHANDLSRQATGVASNSITPANYLNLSGSNVLVALADTGVDATHPDLLGRVFGSPDVLVDTNSHGTFVAGEIAGNGVKSLTVTNAQGSIMPATNGQFRGKAPLAKLFVMNFETNSDQTLQQNAALTNALISNNSWNLDGDTAYDLEAASYDAATRDSLPGTTGSQGVLYVFSAGNDGNGGNNGVGGTQDSVLSPATAKDVIAAGSIEQQRQITNYVTAADGTSNQIWLPETDTPFEVAGFSARGNVGVGTEGPNGRFKPDVVAPGTFVISTRSQQWDKAAYYYQNPTNEQDFTYENQTVDTDENDVNLYHIGVPGNAVGVVILIQQNGNSPLPANMPIYVQQSDFPDPVNDPADIDFTTSSNMVSIPPDSGGNITGIQSLLGNGFYFAIGNSTNFPVTYNVLTEIITTNALGDEETVLSNLNESIGPWYRYESGTSMSAGDVSGVLALMQDYFTNTLHTTPSPALLKALLINGARADGNYNFNQSDGNNYQGWGLINLPNSVPAGATNSSGSNSVFYLDQSPTNALATGDSHTFLVNISSNSTALPFRVTLAWTDPAGNPAAAIKLVNNLDLIVSNMATNTVYYGNDIPVSGLYNFANAATNPPNLDTINNVENVFLPPLFAGNYSVTVVGRGVNVNAVTAQTNNIVQDYALVISCGGGLTPGAIKVTDGGGISNPTGDQLITGIVATNSPLFNQFVGANSPLLGTNTVAAGGGTGYATNAIVTVGQTNQWHFYIVTNTTGFTNAAFITFLPPTLSTPRMGVFADSDANSTTPEADIDLYVAGPGDPNAASLTNLNPSVISNCVYGASGDGASLSRGGTEFVVYTNSTMNQIYYIGVKSETQMASEYAFLPIFTQTPFSQLNPDGSQTVNGIPLPTDIPDGSPAHPGAGYVFGIALYPMQIENVTVSNEITHQNIGDLIGVLAHDAETDVLNNHFSTNSPPAPGPYDFLYDDSQNPVPGSQPSAGRGLGKFVGQQAVGLWQLTEVDDSQGQTGSITGFSLLIEPHKDPTKQPVTVTLQPGEFLTTFVDVPVGATNLTIFATNITATAVQPVELFVQYGTPPTTNNFDAMTLLNTSTPLGPAGFISISATNQPPLRPGRYFFSLFNPSVNPPQTVTYFATIGVSLTGATPLDFNSSGPTPLADDAVTTSTISVANTDPIAAMNVGIRVDHPRISDMIFHLISPDGSRYLLMENRGAFTTNGAGVSYFTTNTTEVPHDGDNHAYTNVINTGTTSGTITINYDFFVLPDSMDVYYQGALIYSNHPAYTGNDISGTTNIAYGPGASTDVTIIVNAGGNTNFPSTAWTYSVTSTTAKYAYLTFTEDTNLTTTPIKFAPPPFTPVPSTVINLFVDDFETNTPGPYTNGQTLDNFIVTSNSVTVVNDPTNGAGGSSNYVALGNGFISAILPTIVGQPYIFQYSYRGSDLSIVGGVQEISVAASTNWQTHYVKFTAAQTGTPVSIQGTGSGALLDNVIFTELPPTLYYQPEQSLAPIIGTSPAGPWTLEMQDNRVGAYDSNSPPVLQDWQLEFVLASTNALMPPVFTNAPADTNMDEQTILVITNGAVAANTNLVLTYSLLNPPADGWAVIDPNTGIITLSPQEVDGPTNFVITTLVMDNGSTALSAVNSFTVTVNEVNTPPFWPPGVPSQTNYTILDLSTLIVTNTATDPDIPTNTRTYRLLTPLMPAGVIIDTNTGIITWTPTLVQQTNIYTIGTIVTDTNVYALTNQSLSNTNFFTVTVLPPLSLTNDVPSTNSIGIGAGGILWYLVRVPTNADIATNILLFASGPLNIWFSTNSPPTITTTNDFDLIPNATNGSSILSVTSSPTNIVTAGLYYLGVQNTNNFAVTNYAVEVDFHLVIPGIPFAATLPAKAVTGTNALLNGFATPSGLPATAWFQWGFTTNYGALTPPVNVGLGFGVVYVSNSISSLIPGQTYHYRLVTSNSVAVVNGFDQIIGEGNVVAWGFDSNGQTNIPVGLSNIVAVAGGGFFSLGLKNDGTVVAWGDDSQFQTNIPAGLSNVVEIAAGAYHGVALKNDGTVVVWGETAYGDTNVPAGLSNVVMVAAGSGGHHTLALKSDGTVVAWGAGLTNSGAFPNYGQSIVPAGLTNIVSVAGGGSHSLALQNNGSVVAWGAGLTNNPADGVDYGQAIVPAGLTNAVAVAGGEFHSLALKNDETVLAWGAGTNNTGVNPTNGQSKVPAGLTNAVVVSGGEFHSLALKADGTMIAWGDNSFGQTNIPASFTNVVGVSAGAYHNLALTSFLFNAPINYAPFWPTNPPPQTVNELALLTVTNTATDTNSPPDALTYSVSISVNYALMLTNGWPTNFAGTIPSPSIDTNGVITWIPSETQGPGVYTITTIVTDTNVFVTTNQSLSATNSFTVTVNETNSAPFWLTNPPPQTVNELTLLTVTNRATDTDSPPNTLTYSVSMSINTNVMIASNWPTIYATTNPPPIINSTNGVITWIPSETQGPGVYTITTIVTDTNLYALAGKSLSATNSFQVTVNEVNSAPFFTNTLPTNTVITLTTLTVTNTAVDTDSPPNTLTYRLLNPPTPVPVTIDTNTGVITWTPPAAFAFTTNTIGVIATDFNPYALTNKNLSATNFFVVIVLPPPYSATLVATAVTGINAQMNGMATPNGLPAFAWFQWGTSGSYGNLTAPVSVGSGRNVIYVTNVLSGLTLAQVYHCRLVTSNNLAVTYGFDQIFDVGGVVAWGSNGAGNTNVPPVLTNTAVAISAGNADSLALRNNARPLGWGDNTSGQTNIPPSLTNVVAISSGGSFNLALRNNGRVVGWGDNTFSQTNVPATLSNVVAVAAGGFHSLALRTNGTVVAWGYNGAGETNVPATLSNVVAVAAGQLHSLALKNDGTVVAWGDNTSGETNVPAGLNTVVAIAGGQSYCLALKTNGTVVAWGNNAQGETNVPAGLSNVVAIAAGVQHCLALKSDGTVVAWGDDTFNETNVPANLSNVAAIAGGGSFSLALVAATPVNPNTAPFFLTAPTNHFMNVGATLTVTNTAKDTDIPAQTLTYILSTAPANASINSANGVITFSPVVAQAGTTNAITTVVTDSGVPNLSATNSFFVLVNPIPFISSVTFTTNALTLNWNAWTNEQFNVQWTTNLAPVINWTTFPNLITSTTGVFSFTDTNAPFLAKFYRLILLP